MGWPIGMGLMMLLMGRGAFGGKWTGAGATVGTASRAWALS
jgi:hypothetical protein